MCSAVLVCIKCNKRLFPGKSGSLAHVCGKISFSDLIDKINSQIESCENNAQFHDIGFYNHLKNSLIKGEKTGNVFADTNAGI